MAHEYNHAHLIDGKWGITDLIDLEELRGLFEQFTQATDFSIGFMDHPGPNLLAAAGWKDICTKFHRSGKACDEICRKSNRKLLDALNNPGKTTIDSCEFGLIDCIVPVMVNGVHVASLSIGQLLLAPPDIERFRCQAREHGFDEEEYLAALEDVRIVSPDKLQKVTAFLGLIATIISKLGYANLLIKESAQSLENEIHDRMRIEETLRSSEMLNQRLVEHLPHRVFIKDRHSTYITCNANYAKDLGITPEQIVGKDDFAFHPPALAEIYRSYDRATMESGHASIIDERYHISGQERWIHITKVPFHDAQGQVIGVLGTFEDITDRKRAELALALNAQRTQGLLQLNQMMDATLPEITAFALLEAIRLTRSGIGYLAFLDEHENLLSMHSWPTSAMEEWTIAGHSTAGPGRLSRLWEEAIQQRKPTIVNSHTSPSAMGRSKDSRTVQRYINLPLLVGSRIVLVAGVGNKGEAYDQSDIEQLRLFMEGVWRILRQQQAEHERRKLEEQLLMAQKMEAVGTLAGGVAHDFNNLLTVILNYTDFAIEGLPEDSPLHGMLMQVRTASDHATSLVRQLLAFSRRQVLQPVPLNLNLVVMEVETLLRRILGEDIEVIEALDPALGMVLADPGQIEQVLMNLVINARDAMPGGGRLTLETANVRIDEQYVASHMVVKPGHYVVLSVTDTGCGMDDQTKAKIFEPFFTTKEMGKGTGLGLSTVYGIVKQSGGNIWVYSEPGLGTTFKLYLRRDYSAASPLANLLQTAAAPVRAMGTETILVVEDVEVLREVCQKILESVGYTVLTAANGEEALRTSIRYTGEIHLLLTDVVMPRKSGKETAQEILKSRPTIKIIFMSGYTDNAIVHHGVLDAGTHFLQKPFSQETLTRMIRQVLDSEVIGLAGASFPQPWKQTDRKDLG